MALRSCRVRALRFARAKATMIAFALLMQRRAPRLLRVRARARVYVPWFRLHNIKYVYFKKLKIYILIYYGVPMIRKCKHIGTYTNFTLRTTDKTQSVQST